MKIRTGFVSNSSSSSFVVILPKRPQTKAELRRMLFGKCEYHYVDEYYDYEDNECLVSDIVDFAYPIIAKQKKSATLEEVAETISSGYFESYVDFFGRRIPGSDWDYGKALRSRGLDYDKKEDRKEIEKIYNQYEQRNKRNAKKIAKKFITEKIHGDHFVLIVEFSDNDRNKMGSICEHANIFYRYPHIQTSMH